MDAPSQPCQHLDLGLLSFAVVEATQLWHFVLAAPGHSCTVVWLALICSEGPDNQGELTTAPETHAPDVLIISRKKYHIGAARTSQWPILVPACPFLSQVFPGFDSIDSRVMCNSTKICQFLPLLLITWGEAQTKRDPATGHTYGYGGST